MNERDVSVMAELASSIHRQIPGWLEVARRGDCLPTASPAMLVASALVGQGIMYMLHLQVRPENIDEMVESVFDGLTDPDAMLRFAELRDDRGEILKYIKALMSEQQLKRSESRAQN